ncbi:TPA: hypothetical protein ACKOIF_000918 [Clostridioides difficile]
MKEELNIVPFLAESLSINKKCYKLIDKYYNENKLKYSSLAKDNIFYNSRIASEGSIIQEYYFKKSLGILLERDEKKITKIFKVGYTIAYNYIISIQTFKASTFLRKLMLKNKIESFSEDELNGNMLVAISLCGALGKEVDESDEIYIKVIRNLILRNENYKHEKVLSIDRLSKDEQKLISKIELRLKSTYLKEYIPSSYTIGIDGSIGTFNLDALTDLDKNLLGFDYIYDLEELSLISIVGRDIFKSKQIQELILCYCNLQKNIEDENSINYEDLFKFIIPAVDIRYLAREYKEAKKFLKVVDMNIDKIKEEATKIYKEYYLIEITNAIRISINLKGVVKSTISSYQGYSDDIFNMREIIVYEFSQKENNLNDFLGELCFLNDYEEFATWCDAESESLDWDSYEKFNKENFDELVERNIEDSLPGFLEELSESIETRKQELKSMIEI